MFASRKMIMHSGKVHFIAIGGAVMHNLALDLLSLGYEVTGSDDEIYEPALSRLQRFQMLPEQFGWFPEKIHEEIDFIVLGMHAKPDNPELEKAQRLQIPIYSYPELVRKFSEDKKRVVVAGSHGKTTITSMLLFFLQKKQADFDYLVGAQIAGFDKMVKISKDPLIVLEGDEYLSSPIDRRSKFIHYQPHISVLTGIAWDHVNVFPTYQDYFQTFVDYLHSMPAEAALVYNIEDDEVVRLVEAYGQNLHCIPYRPLQRGHLQNSVFFEGKDYAISVIGEHNLSNLSAAMAVGKLLGYAEHDFLENIRDFSGAAKRLQKLYQNENRVVYLDFAHSPSKVRATATSFADWFKGHPVLAVYELHTFSSLDPDFLPQYKGTLDGVEDAIVYYSAHTIQMKNRPLPDDENIRKQFHHSNLTVISNQEELRGILTSEKYKNHHILLMTSGNFDSLDYKIFEK